MEEYGQGVTINLPGRDAVPCTAEQASCYVVGCLSADYVI